MPTIGMCCSGLIVAMMSLKPNSEPAQKCDFSGAGLWAVTVMVSVGEATVIAGFQYGSQDPHASPVPAGISVHISVLSQATGILRQVLPIPRRPRAPVPPGSEQMAAPRLLGLEIKSVVVVGLDRIGHPFGHGDAVALDGFDLGRVVGQEADPVETQLAPDFGGRLVDPLIGFKSQLLIGLDRVQARILQAVGTQLVDQTDAPALLSQIDQDSAAGRGDRAD